MLRIIGCIIAFSSSSLYAAVGGTIDRPPGVISAAPIDLLSGIITYSIGIAAILGVIGITWGGIQMILSVGEDEKMKKARYMMIYSIGGVILAGLAYGIVSLVGQLRI